MKYVPSGQSILEQFEFYLKFATELGDKAQGTVGDAGNTMSELRSQATQKYSEYKKEISELASKFEEKAKSLKGGMENLSTTVKSGYAKTLGGLEKSGESLNKAREILMEVYDNAAKTLGLTKEQSVKSQPPPFAMPKNLKTLDTKKSAPVVAHAVAKDKEPASNLVETEKPAIVGVIAVATDAPVNVIVTIPVPEKSDLKLDGTPIENTNNSLAPEKVNKDHNVESKSVKTTHSEDSKPAADQKKNFKIEDAPVGSILDVVVSSLSPVVPPAAEAVVSVASSLEESTSESDHREAAAAIVVTDDAILAIYSIDVTGDSIDTKPAAATTAVEHLSAALPDDLNKSISSLDNFLSQLSLSPDVLAAKSELAFLTENLTSMTTDEMDLVWTVAKEYEKIYEDTLHMFQKGWEDKVAEVQKEGEEKVKEVREQLALAKDKEIEGKLRSQEELFKSESQEQLMKQESEMTKQFAKEIKRRLDGERQGRLARLDDLALKVKILEKMTVDYANGVGKATAIFRSMNALDAARNSFKRGSRAELAKCLNILDDESNRIGGYTAEMVHYVVSNLPEESLDDGVESMASLQSRFESLSGNVRKTAFMPDSVHEGGLWAYVVSSLLSNLLFKKHVTPLAKEWEGEDVESILARAEHYLFVEENLDAGTRELTSLRGWGKLLAKDWLRSARSRLEIEQGMKVP